VRAVALVILLVIFTYATVTATLPAVQGQRRAAIRVHVIDQNARDYEKVGVEVWRVDLVDSGNTDYQGLWESMQLDGDGRTYTVKVYNGQYVSREVEIISTDVFVEFTLQRQAPAPDLELSTVEYSPANLIPGNAFSAKISVSNIGSLSSNSSLFSFLTLPTQISMLESGSTFNLGSLGPGENKTLTIRMAVDLSAHTGSYLLPYQMTSITETGYSYAFKGAFGLLVGGVPDVRVHDVIVDPSSLVRGADGILTLELINAGTEVAEKLTVRMYSAGILTSTISYVGKMDRDVFVDLTFGIHVDKYEKIGPHMLNLTVTYMDPNGNSFVESKQYAIEVLAPASLLPSYDIGLIVLSAVLIVVALFSLRRMGVKL
jgi:hypothetical protein